MGAVEQLVERNERFAEHEHRRLDYLPRLSTCVVTCPDPRVDPAQVLGLEIGDAAVVRAAAAVGPGLVYDVDTGRVEVVERRSPLRPQEDGAP